MTESELETRVQSLIKLKQLPDVSLDEEVSRNWNEVLNEEYLFDRLQREVTKMQNLVVGMENWITNIFYVAAFFFLFVFYFFNDRWKNYLGSS